MLRTICTILYYLGQLVWNLKLIFVFLRALNFFSIYSRRMLVYVVKTNYIKIKRFEQSEDWSIKWYTIICSRCFFQRIDNQRIDIFQKVDHMKFKWWSSTQRICLNDNSYKRIWFFSQCWLEDKATWIYESFVYTLKHKTE